MKQLFKAEELVGKTIEKFIFPEHAYDDLWLKFTDNSFVVIYIKNISRGFEVKELISISDSEVESSSEELVTLGVITEKQYNKAVADEKAAREIQSKQDELIRLQQIEKDEKDLLVRLKKKYGEL